MLKAPLFDSSGERIGEIPLSDEVFDKTVNPHVLYEVVKMYLANQRAGTSKAKNRSEVAGSRAKIWPQKGTGRARHGDRKAPIFRGGGVIHPPEPRDYRYRVPSRIRRLAMCGALSDRAREDKIMVFKELRMEEPKTSKLAALLNKIGIGGRKALLLPGTLDRNLTLSGRNIPGVSVVPSNEANAMDVLRAEYIVLDEKGLSNITERLSR